MLYPRIKGIEKVMRILGPNYAFHDSEVNSISIFSDGSVMLKIWSGWAFNANGEYLDDFLDGAFHSSTFEFSEECEHFILWLKLLYFHTLILFLATKVIGASARFRQMHFFYILPLFCRR